jgi:hypothetical protein
MSESLAQRDEAFTKVEAAYRGFYEDLRGDGLLPYRSTKAGMWATSGMREVYGAFRHFHLHQYNHIADLGSGDGIVVLIGSLFTHATGYETDDWLYKKSIKLSNSLNLANARFLQQNFLQADLSVYDLLYLYPDKPFDDLVERLRTTWSGRLLVNGPHFPPRYFNKIGEYLPARGTFVLYESTQSRKTRSA